MSLSSTESHGHKVMDGYRMMRKIGIGTSSDVYLARNRINDQLVAVKVIKRDYLTGPEEESVLFEIKMMKMFNHKHIVKMIDHVLHPRYVFIIQEYCDGGTLLDYIRNYGRLSETSCQQVVQQLALALKYMRTHNISHLDLKPDNIFLMKLDGELFIKLGDFGLSKLMTEDTKLNYFCGSLVYMAPEMIVQKEFDIKADLWSIGIIIYQCLFEVTPYRLVSNVAIPRLFAEMRKKIPIEIPPDLVSPMCRDLLLGLLRHDPSDRINHKQFYIHPFVDLDHMACQLSSSESIKATLEKTQFKIKTGIVKYEHSTQINPSVKRIYRLKQNYFKLQEEMATYPHNCSSQTLRTACQNLPVLDFAIETGVSSKLYAFEGDIESAMERINVCLRSLKLLDQQPSDIVCNEMIKQQITEWTKQYNDMQTLLQSDDQRVKEHSGVCPLDNFIAVRYVHDESTDDETTDDHSTDDLSTDDQSIKDQPVINAGDQSADTPEECIVIRCKRLRRIKRWYNAFIGFFRRRNN